MDAEREVLTGAGHGDLSVAGLIGTSPSAAPSTSPSASAPDSASKPWSIAKTMSYLTGFLSRHSSRPRRNTASSAMGLHEHVAAVLR
ncbi:hypothetical protein ABT215_16905 [Streptomyces sp900105755]